MLGVVLQHLSGRLSVSLVVGCGRRLASWRRVQGATDLVGRVFSGTHFYPTDRLTDRPTDREREPRVVAETA